MASPPRSQYMTTIDRYYIDTRPLVPSPSNPKSRHSLPLLSTLQFSDQEAVTRFIRPADRFMSLASALLKYYFIHRRAKIPWSEVHISRTPHPHRRPFWEPPEDWEGQDESYPGGKQKIKGLEFNVSHQAGLVAIIGCSTPTPQLPNSHADSLAPNLPESLDHMDLTGHHTLSLPSELIRLGVDIACTNEDKRTPKDLTTQAKFDEWVDIFAEMFSDRERRNMRVAPIHVPVVEREEGDGPGSDGDDSPTDHVNSVQRDREAKIIQLKLRRFYAYWGLKEAYIKMVGEGLLASWLRELEFLDVVAPPVPAQHANHTHTHNHKNNSSSGFSVVSPETEIEKWSPPSKAEKRMTTLLRGRKVEDVDIELVAYDADFMVATAMRGVREAEPDSSSTVGESTSRRRWLKLDIEKDVRPCAEGRCRCLG
ncbi:uncharacterized protein Z518_07452 [Rhinocladiella mackenziei CBS 650.93]|uniref:holo-[acyl-carrier-protein] synthase n=1 Tax=Rhinocladiella mackenziei CBS 650.93 TaxID=1442369 RepID=A0A0D2IDK0_9EURO|nr:uncharacterized protein Z518_07452 [Rhinocladiella mackenziei CBS 650.93]KIX03899.1 hypothetical protein Z518_07452 [Rhinocladiella mackenziei CBS 650.93]